MAQLTRIGNSMGIRIPKAIIEMAGLRGRDLRLKVVEGGLLVATARRPRQGWREAFQTLHEAGDDRLLLGDFSNQFDVDEWEW